MGDPTRPAEPLRPASEPEDLGFGSKLGRPNERRLLNRDGTFNARRTGLPFLSSLSVYHYLLTMSWPSFFLGVIATYIGTNVGFAFAYLLCGPNAMMPGAAPGIVSHFAKAFFFSVNTLGTIGYGSSGPGNLAANVVVAAESLLGLLGFALATGILFARFSRPIGELMFSRSAVIAPYQNTTAFMFRVVNRRSNQLIELEATVLFSRIVDGTRQYDKLSLARSSVVFFPLSWTVVHPIDERSPMWKLSQADLNASDAEILILITGTDETFAQSVHARSSYKPDEIAFGRRFVGMYRPVSRDGVVKIDVRKLSAIEAVPA